MIEELEGEKSFRISLKDIPNRYTTLVADSTKQKVFY